MSKAISVVISLKVTGAVGAAGLLAACGGNGGACFQHRFCSRGCFRGWPEQRSRYPDHELVGGESRYNAYQEALKASLLSTPPSPSTPPSLHGPAGRTPCPPSLQAAWLRMSARSTGTGCTTTPATARPSWSEQRHRLPGYVPVGRRKAGACNVANAQQCVPISMTGRVFTGTTTLTSLASPSPPLRTCSFAARLSRRSWAMIAPLHLGAYDRMTMMVFTRVQVRQGLGRSHLYPELHR